MQRAYQLSEITPTRAEGELADLLRRKGMRRRFAGGTLIQQQGDEGGGFWLIDTGAVSLCRFAASGSITVYAALGPGELFGELAYLAGVSRQVDAVADEDTVLVRISTLLVDRMLETEPSFARWLLKSLANQLRLALDRIEGDNHLSARARMIRVLADLTQRNGLEIAITQQALGELIGVSRVTAGQILRELEASQLLRLEYRRIIVLAPERLTAARQC